MKAKSDVLAKKPVSSVDQQLGSGAMFDGIAHRYDLLNRLMSLGLDQRWRKKTARALNLGAPRTAARAGSADRTGPATARALDLATGTADLALVIARQHGDAEILGIDPSARMLDVGRRKVADAGLDSRIELALGDAQALDAGDDTFDGVCIAFGIRNVPDRSKALAEMVRVTRPGGRIAILELSEPRKGVMGSLARFYVHVFIPRMGALLSGSREYRYLQKSIEAFPPAEEFAAMMRAAGIEMVRTESLSFGACHLYVGRVPDRDEPAIASGEELA